MLKVLFTKGFKEFESWSGLLLKLISVSGLYKKGIVNPFEFYELYSSGKLFRRLKLKTTCFIPDHFKNHFKFAG
jgi:hypothetical protein